MSSAKYRLFHRISHSNLFTNKSTFRLIISQKQCISTLSLKNKTIFASNPRSIFSNHNLSATHSSYSFSSKSKDDVIDSDDSDDDSDFSDFSDFDSSDDDEADEIITKQDTKPAKDQKKAWQFDHGEISPDLLMKDRLIISNLNFSTNRNDIWELCENYGSVVDVHLPANKNRDFHNRGFGFVTFETEQDAANALENIAGCMYNSRQLRAGYARKDTDRSSGSYQNKSDRSEFKFTSSPTPKQPEMKPVSVNRESGIPQAAENTNTKLNETAISISGLPGNVNLAQITRMFGDLGDISNISLSPYMMFGYSFMSAVVSVKLRNGSLANVNTESVDKNPLVEERNIKDRSVDRTRRNVADDPINKVGGVDPDILAKEIDELLADTDDEEGDESLDESDEDDELQTDTDDDSDLDDDVKK